MNTKKKKRKMSKKFKLRTLRSSKICRICLCRDRKLYIMKKYNLFVYYEQITNINAFNENRMPHFVCWECGVRLVSAASFRAKALRSNTLLQDMLSHVYLDRNILTNGREKLNLTTNLKHKSFEVNHADFHFVYTEPSHPNIPDIQEINLPDINNENSQNSLSDSSCDETLFKISKKLKNNEIHTVEKIEQVKIIGEVEEVEEIAVKKVDKRYKPANEVLNEDIFHIADLSHEQQILEIQSRQFSSNYKNSEFKCTECFKGFLDEDAYKGHMNRHTDQCGTYQCHICKIRFKKLQALRNHTTCHMQKFSCKKCTYITFRRHAAKLHEEYHNGTKYTCPHCPENFDKISTYMSHIRIKHPSDIVCELCGYSFVSAKGLGLHKKLKHRFDDQQVPSDGPCCTKCDVQFINTEALERHIRLSTRHSDELEPTRKQERRPREFLDRNNTRKHREAKKKRNCKPEEPISCEQCEMQLPDPLSYYRHFRRVHPDKNRTKYPSMKSKSMCEVCGKMFQSLALLQDHSWTHTDDKHFKCSQCDKRFQRKYRLIAHRRVHGDTRCAHACSVCGKAFSTASNMQRHMVSHTGLKPFICEMCDKCFKHASEKRVHITYVHLKKPWPKRARGKRKDNTQNQLPPAQPPNAGEMVQPQWPACNEPKMNMMEDKPMYYNSKI